MSSLYDRIAARPDGERDLAAARLRYEVLVLLSEAFEASGLASQAELAKKLKVRRSAVNQVFRGDGNLRVQTLAEYLHEMGFELDMRLVPAGEPRRAEIEERPVRHAFSMSTVVTPLLSRAEYDMITFLNYRACAPIASVGRMDYMPGVVSWAFGGTMAESSISAQLAPADVWGRSNALGTVSIEKAS